MRLGHKICDIRCVFARGRTLGEPQDFSAHPEKEVPFCRPSMQETKANSCSEEGPLFLILQADRIVLLGPH
jgi:hypothetical protein